MLNLETKRLLDLKARALNKRPGSATCGIWNLMLPKPSISYRLFEQAITKGGSPADPLTLNNTKDLKGVNDVDVLAL